jgi:hypothetical protein
MLTVITGGKGSVGTGKNAAEHILEVNPMDDNDSFGLFHALCTNPTPTPASTRSIHMLTGGRGVLYWKEFRGTGVADPGSGATPESGMGKKSNLRNNVLT